MKQEHIILAILLLFGLLCVVIIIKREKYPYRQKMLLTKTEYAFYQILKKECDKYGFLICPKVRMEDFLEITDQKNYMKYRGYVKSRHIDFMICDSKLYLLCGIELDDKSHETKHAQKIDKFKDNVFRAIALPLYRVKVEPNSYRSCVREILDELG